jgi:hypothetical protein
MTTLSIVWRRRFTAETRSSVSVARRKRNPCTARANRLVG